MPSGACAAVLFAAPDFSLKLFRISHGRLAAVMKRKMLLLYAVSALSAETAFSEDWLKDVWQMNRDTVVKADPTAKTVLWMQGELAAGADNPHQIHLDSKRHYTFFADCERGCNKLGLTLIQDGRVLRRDWPPHAFPMMGWQAVEEGSYTLQVDMRECGRKECRYSLQVFEGGKRVF